MLDVCSAVLVLFMQLGQPGFADDAKWKLQPLRYNNEGLVVDLGVGLWAYPIPIDYDSDGDIDLLVGCPDKPSSGTYYFENPTQDPTNPLPVFKPAVRIGNGYHYMMLSHLGDEPVVLTPAKMFRCDNEQGTFDFSRPAKIDLPVKPLPLASSRTRGNMWRYVDFDGDGDHDIAVGIGDWTDLGWDHAYDRSGVWRNGPLHGYVYIFTNSGSDDAPDYSSAPTRLQAGGGDVDVYGWPCPHFADFDQDGDLDLLCGEFMDGFSYFQNTGTRNEPVYAAAERLTDSSGTLLRMHLQMITPTAIDWDRDGDMDLIVGDEDGRVALVENSGTLSNRVPVFEKPVYFQQQADTLKFGALATPYVNDWDADGDQDILCGNTAGEVGMFENLGLAGNGLPKWAAPVKLRARNESGVMSPFRIMAGENGSIQGPCEAKWGYTTLSVADWDDDGDDDIIYNSILARLGVLVRDRDELTDSTVNLGQSELPPKWNWLQAPSSETLTQWRTTPVAIDFDGDDELDLVMMDQDGYLTLRPSLAESSRAFLTEQLTPLRLNAGTCGGSGRVKLAVVDWDQDGRMDLLTNSENATWYRNVKDHNGKYVMKKVGNVARRNVAGHTSSPAVCDFDDDGVPDLLVGSENGRIYHIKHDECVSFTSEQTSLGTAASETSSKPNLPFAGYVKDEFVFTKAKFKQCHASTICETTRGLVSAWFGGTKEGADDVGIWTSYHDGLKWSSPVRIADGVQHEGLRYPCWNPVLFQPPGDAPTLLFFKVGPSPRQWWGEVMISYDRGRTFRDRRRLPEGIAGPVRCSPLLLPDGKTLLCGSSTEDQGWRVHFESVRLVDGQMSGPWWRSEPVDGTEKFSAIQPTFFGDAARDLRVLCRTKEGVVASSRSSDLGRTWSPLQGTDLLNPNSGIDAITMPSGQHLLVYNPTAWTKKSWGKRSVLSLAISNDGESWSTVAQLERQESGEFSYPAMIIDSDGLVHITYTYQREKIKHVIIDPAKLKTID